MQNTIGLIYLKQLAKINNNKLDKDGDKQGNINKVLWHMGRTF